MAVLCNTSPQRDTSAPPRNLSRVPRVQVRCGACDRTIAWWTAPHLGRPGGPGPVYCVSGRDYVRALPDLVGLFSIRCSGGKRRECGQRWLLHDDQLEAFIVSAARVGRREVFIGRDDIPQDVLPRGDELLSPRGIALMQATADELGVPVSAVLECVDGIAADTGELVDPRELVPAAKYLKAHRSEFEALLARTG